MTAKDVWADLLIDNYVFGYWKPYISRIILLSPYSLMIVYSRPWTMGIYQILSTNSPRLPYLLISNYTTYVNLTLWKYNWNLSNPVIRNLTALGKAIQSLQLKVDWVDGPFWIDPNSITNLGFVGYKNPYYWRANRVWFTAVNFVIASANRAFQVSLEEEGLLGAAIPGIPISMLQTLNQTGKIFFAMTPEVAGFGIAFKFIPPFNSSLVREAFAYLINTSEVAFTYPPIYQSISFVGSTAVTGLAPWLYQEMSRSGFTVPNNYTYNVSKGFSLLREAGWKQVNGQWYFPNGSPQPQ